MASYDSKRKTITVLSIILGLASFACMIAAFNVSTDTEYDGYAEGFYYDESDDGVCIRDCNLIGDIVIPEMLNDKEVTEIGNSAFNACRGVTSITIPDSVTSIGDSAFSDCDGLTSVTIGNGVTNFGDGAFSSCDGLTNIHYNAKAVNNLLSSSNVFYGSGDSGTGISVVFGNSVENIPAYLFDGCEGLTSVTIGNSVTSIGEDAFSGCDGLTSLTIGNCVTSIGDSAFSGCGGLIRITIPNSVTSIGESAFSDCDRLNRITIPNSVTSIGDSAFNGCNRLTTIYYNAEAVNDLSSWSNVFHNAGSSGTGISVVFGDTVKKIPAWLFHDCGGLTSVTIGNSVTSIRDSAFEGCDGLTSVTIGNSVTSFGNGVFSDCDGLTSVYIYDVANWCKISFAGELSNPLYFAKNLYLNGVLVTDLAIPDDVTSIGDFAFSGCDGLTSVTIGNSVAIIGSSAFAGCDELASVTIGNGVTSIENGAFLDCDGLMSVYINDVTNWCKISFADYSSNPLFYAKNFYLNAVLVTALTIPDSVTSIGANAFDGCDGLTSITIPDSVTSIGASAFYNCNGLTIYCEATSLPGGWDRNWNLYGCPVVWNCKNNDLADDGYIYTVVDGIRYRLKSDVAEVTRQSSLIRGDIVLLETITYNLAVYRVTSIGPGAFTQCDGLISVAIPDSVTSIGNSAFYGCDGLTSVTIGNGVTSIGSSAFGYCSRLTSVTVGNSVTSISYSAFNSCSRLTSIVIPDSVTSIGDRAFYGCDELTIYCEATRRPWGWNQDWNSSDCPVVWGYKGNSITSE